MSEKEKQIMEKLSDIVSGLPDTKKERLLGVAEGMSIMKEAQENASDKKAVQEVTIMNDKRSTEKCSVTVVKGDKQQSILTQSKDKVTLVFEQTSLQKDSE